MPTADTPIINPLRDGLADSFVSCEIAKPEMVDAVAAAGRLAIVVERGNTLGLRLCSEHPFDPVVAPSNLKKAESGNGVDAGSGSTVENRVRNTLSRLDKFNPAVLAVVERCDALALEAACRVDGAAHGNRTATGPLAGTTFTVKDVFDLMGHPTRANSRLMQDRAVEERSAETVQHLMDAGAVPVGKTVCWELSIAETDDADALFPRALNPWNPSRDTGGSSSGSASAVAAGLCDFSICTDTGGSSRGPASWCGVVGYKASTGLFPMKGCIPLSPDFDSIGLMARRVDTCIQAYDALTAGKLNAGKRAVDTPLRVGVWRSAYQKDAAATPHVTKAFEDAVAVQIGGPVEIVEIELPPLDYFSAAYVILARAQTYKTWRGAVEANPKSVGAMARNRIMSCGIFDQDLVDQAETLRDKLHASIDSAFRSVDAIATPTMPFVAPGCADAALVMAFDKPSYVRFASLFGLPSISLPCGLSPEGLPVGLMLTGAAGQDQTLLQIAKKFEGALPILTPPNV